MGSAGGGEAGRAGESPAHLPRCPCCTTAVCPATSLVATALHTVVGDEDRVGVRVSVLALPPQFTPELPELHSGWIPQEVTHAPVVAFLCGLAEGPETALFWPHLKAEEDEPALCKARQPGVPGRKGRRGRPAVGWGGSTATDLDAGAGGGGSGSQSAVSGLASWPGRWSEISFQQTAKITQ